MEKKSPMPLQEWRIAIPFDLLSSVEPWCLGGESTTAWRQMGFAKTPSHLVLILDSSEQTVGARLH